MSYMECRSAVLEELFKELFRHHGPDEDMAVAEAQMKLYGQLLGLKHQQLSPSNFDCNQLTLKVRRFA